MQLDYLDLVLLHQPFKDYHGAYRALVDLYKEGKIKASGVSNFYPNILTNFCEVVKVKQVSYAEKYNENKKKSKNQAQSNKEQERMMKHKDEKNPYIAASLFATVVAIVLAMFPWNLLGSGIGTSLPMRIAVVIFALLGDYHVTKAKQVNNLIFSKYGFRIKSNVVSMVNVLSVFVTIMGMFALFTY